MIVRRNLKWSVILRDTWREVLSFLLMSLLAYTGYHGFGIEAFAIPYLPVGTLSTALAIFLGFRGNSAYDRWWEARRLWGSLVNLSRAFARQAVTFPDNAKAGLSRAELAAFQQALVYRHLAFVNALRLHLRKQTETDSVMPFLEESEGRNLLGADNRPNWLLMRQGKALRWAADEGLLSEFRFMQMDALLTEFNNIQGGCERIKNTPFPRQYNYFPILFVYLHAFLLPFSFVRELGLVAIPLSVAVSFVFLTLDKISQRLEDPFENKINDVPMTALCRTIEINLREQLGEAALPPKPEPVDGFLF